MKKSLIVMALGVFLSLPCALCAEEIDCCANCDTTCVHYERYALRCLAHTQRPGQYIRFWFSDACEEKKLEEVPVLDSVWITRSIDSNTILYKSYAQVGDIIGVDSISGEGGYFYLHAQLGKCVKRARFALRPSLPAAVENIESENSHEGWEKLLQDGKLFIRRGDKTYNAQGLRVE